jgi:hypothetical protein
MASWVTQANRSQDSKLATRIVTELREKAGKMMIGHTASTTARTAGTGTSSGLPPSEGGNPVMAANGDAVSAIR